MAGLSKPSELNIEWMSYLVLSTVFHRIVPYPWIDIFLDYQRKVNWNNSYCPRSNRLPDLVNSTADVFPFLPKICIKTSASVPAHCSSAVVTATRYKAINTVVNERLKDNLSLKKTVTRNYAHIADWRI